MVEGARPSEHRWAMKGLSSQRERVHDGREREALADGDVGIGTGPAARPGFHEGEERGDVDGFSLFFSR